MNLGFHLSLLSIAVSVTCVLYLIQLPKPSNAAQRIALTNFIWFYALSGLATATYFVTLTQTASIPVFILAATNATMILVSSCSLLLAVRSLSGSPKHILNCSFAWLYSATCGMFLASLFMFENPLVQYATPLMYTNIIGIFGLAMATFIARNRPFNKRQRIFADSLLVIFTVYTLTMVVDLYFNDDNVYFVAFTVAQNVGFAGMLGGIYSFYILQLVEAREFDAITDPLTGLYNRRFLTNRSEWLHTDKLAEKAQLCVIIVDIDHFKKINDTYGHQKGDEVIVRCAQIIQQTVREGDVVIRSGGDEFVILLPNASLQVSIEVAERLTKAIEANTIPHPKGQFKVSTTCGVSGAGTEFERLFQAADNALYDAKASGRNQVCVAQMVPST